MSFSHTGVSYTHISMGSREITLIVKVLQALLGWTLAFGWMVGFGC